MEFQDLKGNNYQSRLIDVARLFLQIDWEARLSQDTSINKLRQLIDN